MHGSLSVSNSQGRGGAGDDEVEERREVGDEARLLVGEQAQHAHVARSEEQGRALLVAA